MAVFRALVVALAAGKVLLSLLAASELVLAEGKTTFPVGLSVAHVAFFGVTGFFLFLAGGQDRRVRDLGALFSLIASSFADSPLLDRAILEPRGSWRLALLPLDAFLPYFAWAFADGFPRVRLNWKAPAIARFCRVAALLLSLSLFARASLFRANAG